MRFRVVPKTGDWAIGSDGAAAMRGRLATCVAVPTAAFGHSEACSIPVDSTEVKP